MLLLKPIGSRGRTQTSNGKDPGTVSYGATLSAEGPS